MADKCLCGKDANIEKCCLAVMNKIIRCKTAEALMRSRFTAYCLGQEDYLLASWHVSTRPSQVDVTEAVEWLGLDICRVWSGLPGDKEGWVEFKASYKEAGALAQIHEKSHFVFEEDNWFYVDGEYLKSDLPGRNKACPCGSGKKSKRCCAK